MVDKNSNGSENGEVANKLSVWMARSQDTRTNTDTLPSSSLRWTCAETNTAKNGIALSYQHLLGVHRQGTVRPWAQWGFAEMIMKHSVLCEISVTMKLLIKKAYPALLKFTKSTARSRAENVCEFSSSARIDFDCFRNGGGNAREWSIWYVSRVF